MQHPDNLIWIDLEMTGLDPDNDVIIEIATIVTDPQLNVLAEGPSLAIKQPDSLLDGMDEWNTRQHGQSGLTRRVRESTISPADAERQTIDFLSAWVPAGKLSAQGARSAGVCAIPCSPARQAASSAAKSAPPLSFTAVTGPNTSQSRTHPSWSA